MAYTQPLLSRAEYARARNMIDAHDEAVRAWREKHKTNGIPADVSAKMPFHDQVTNELRSRVEVYEFCNDIPTDYFLYVDTVNQRATTWTGEDLGSVALGREYQSNFGDWRQPITVYAINDKTYHGTYYKSAGNYARVKIAKETKV